MSFSEDYAVPGEKIDLRIWVEQNALITLDRIPTEVVRGLLEAVKIDFREFQTLMLKGLMLRRQSLKSRPLSAMALAPFCSEARMKVALAFVSKGEAPAVPLFSLAFCDRAENKALNESSLLHFGRPCGRPMWMDLEKKEWSL
jgi:hypothetical protein